MKLLPFIFLVIIAMGQTQLAAAHCDTMEGPVVQTARQALEKGDVTPVLKWVQPEHEKEIGTAFAETLAVRSLGPEAKNLADRYFFETLVRIHRAGEGAPYTGLKAGTEIDPAVLLADQALAESSPEKLITVLTEAAAEGIRSRFARTAASRKQAERSVEAGRRFVANYVEFTHYVERLHQDVAGHAAHRGGEENPEVH